VTGRKQVTRARARPEQTYQRVERIVGMMRRGEWQRGESAPVLAEEWGLVTATVEGLAVEASRVVAREVTDPERVKVDVSTILMRDIERASAVASFGDVARIGDVVTRIVGARAPEKHDHRHVVYEGMTPAQTLDAVRAHIVKLQALEQRLVEQAVPALVAHAVDE
jgi:hypothetical protein